MNLSRLLAVAALYILPGSAVAEELTHLVLKIKSHTAASDGSVTAILESGETLKLQPVVVDMSLSKITTAVVKERAKRNAVKASPSEQTASVISEKCAREWPDDFAMRAYCEKKQRAAVEALGRRDTGNSTMQKIRDKCARDWPSDYSMRAYCEDQQLKGLNALQ